MILKSLPDNIKTAIVKLSCDAEFQKKINTDELLDKLFELDKNARIFSEKLQAAIDERLCNMVLSELKKSMHISDEEYKKFYDMMQSPNKDIK